MIEKNDLYKMQYINTSIDVDDDNVRQEAELYYDARQAKGDITSGFAAYNKVFLVLKKNRSDVSQAKSLLEKAREIFKKTEEAEKLNLKKQLLLFYQNEQDIPKEDVEVTPMHRLILTMQGLIDRNINELNQIDGNVLISFESPGILQESSTSVNEKSDGG